MHVSRGDRVTRRSNVRTCVPGQTASCCTPPLQGSTWRYQAGIPHRQRPPKCWDADGRIPGQPETLQQMQPATSHLFQYRSCETTGPCPRHLACLYENRYSAVHSHPHFQGQAGFLLDPSTSLPLSDQDVRSLCKPCLKGILHFGQAGR